MSEKERIAVNKNFYIFYDQVQALKKHNISASKLVRDLIDDYIKKNKLK